jgi:CMD domain protein
MSAHPADLIDQVLSIAPGSRLDLLRRHREVARENIQKAYIALFEPLDTSSVSLVERLAIASFVAGLHGQLVLGDHYAHLLAVTEGGPGISALITAEIERGQTHGPYGRYPEGPLTSEDKLGPIYSVGGDNQKLLGDKLSAALVHAHLLVFRPRDASREALEALLDAGWTTEGIVTISQLISYLAFQTRIVEGLTALAASAELPVAPFSQALAAGANS